MIARPVVVLPEPLSPTSPTISPFDISKDTPSTALNFSFDDAKSPAPSVYETVRFSTLSSGSEFVIVNRFEFL